MRAGCDLFVSERSRVPVIVSLRRVLQFLPGMLMSCQVFLFPMPLAGNMSMCGALVQLFRTGVVLVVRSVIETLRHN
jgi:hypothetical protein